MRTYTPSVSIRRGRLISIALLSVIGVACAAPPASPLGAAPLRERLLALQADPALVQRARIEFQDAETAVLLAEQPVPKADKALGTHRLYLAQRKVSIAEAKVATQLAEEHRVRLGVEHDAARLTARTREADLARLEVVRAQGEIAAVRNVAQDAADSAARERVSAASAANEQAMKYQAQIAELEAAATERGLVLTLGDVLFGNDRAALADGASGQLDKLVTFLKLHPERRVSIEGHTDNVGGVAYNQALSLRRADTVRVYLMDQGVTADLLTAKGIGMNRPVAGNDTAIGRQRNRRVEVVIENGERS